MCLCVAVPLTSIFGIRSPNDFDVQIDCPTGFHGGAIRLLHRGSQQIRVTTRGQVRSLAVSMYIAKTSPWLSSQPSHPSAVLILSDVY